MLKHKNNLVRIAALISLVAMLIALPGLAFGKDKKDKKDEAAAKPKKNWLEVMDYSKLVWPAPPAITRVRYLNFFSGEKYVEKGEQKKKSSWKDKMAGLAAGEQSAKEKPRFQLVMPYGMAVDSKNRLYIADRKVSAIFIVNTETGDFEMIKNGVHARFGAVIGLAVDDADKLFVSDSLSRRVMVFNAEHKPEAVISEGLASPGGLAIDNENRFLYVADSDNDQVLVYDADPPYKLLRRIGTGGKKHTLTDPGNLAMPSNVAVDQDGNVYVTDTLNNRVQIFDADGNFLKTFGKAGDGPGYFARPKGIAVDADGHIWVADAVQNRVQVFDQEGRLLMWMGGTGIYPGQFRTLAGLAIDKNNRVFTSEQYPGRVQYFRYVTEEEVKVEVARREAEEKPKKGAQGKDESARASEDSTAKQP
jgi:DNA-binding beta-propeller fold protein YncE